MEVVIGKSANETVLERIAPGHCFFAVNASGRYDLYIRCLNITVDGIIVVGVCLSDGCPYSLTKIEYDNNLYQPVINMRVTV